jgi:hypothetical protein
MMLLVSEVPAVTLPVTLPGVKVRAGLAVGVVVPPPVLPPPPPPQPASSAAMRNGAAWAGLSLSMTKILVVEADAA